MWCFAFTKMNIPHTEFKDLAISKCIIRSHFSKSFIGDDSWEESQQLGNQERHKERHLCWVKSGMKGLSTFVVET